MAVLHWLVYNLWPIFGTLMVVFGIFYAFFLVFFAGEKFKGIILGASFIVYGVWVKGVYQYSPVNLTHGGVIPLIWEVLGNTSKGISDLESHWILFGLIPALIASVYWYIRKNEEDAIVLAISAGICVVMLAVTVPWMYYAPHFSQMISLLSYQN